MLYIKIGIGDPAFAIQPYRPEFKAEQACKCHGSAFDLGVVFTFDFTEIIISDFYADQLDRTPPKEQASRGIVVIEFDVFDFFINGGEPAVTLETVPPAVLYRPAPMYTPAVDNGASEHSATPAISCCRRFIVISP